MEPLRESVASMETLLREWFEGLGGAADGAGGRGAVPRAAGRYTSALRQRLYVRRKLVRWVEAGGGAAAEVSPSPSPDRF